MLGPPPRPEPLSEHEMTCVCCNCKRERTAAGEWHEHAPQPGERVTHGICPACIDELYPEIAPLIRADTE